MNDKVYITPGGARTLRDELTHIWKVKRPEITSKVSAAAALGDRSENADYIYGKKALREIDKRIRYLTKRLDNLEIVDRIPDDQERVFFAAWVTLAAIAGDQTTVRIVGSDEFDLSKGWISLNSPMAKALLGKRLFDEVTIETPAGREHYELVAIEYGQPS
ncbi:MAG: transcription elongation factor GreB [Candidatus Azotimanducaceae bacterium]|jgi:transcription elongation factor GreB